MEKYVTYDEFLKAIEFQSSVNDKAIESEMKVKEYVDSLFEIIKEQNKRINVLGDIVKSMANIMIDERSIKK